MSFEAIHQIGILTYMIEYHSLTLFGWLTSPLVQFLACASEVISGCIVTDTAFKSARL